jgi:hypothetical protein
VHPLNIRLRQQIIEDRIEQVSSLLGISTDDAFLRFIHSLIVGRSLHAFDPDDLTEGGQDKQIDVVTIEEDGDSADVWILQAKNSTSFSSNMLVQLGNSLRWMFERPRAELATLANTALRDKIIEYRSIQSNIGPSNLRIHVAFVTKGRTSELSDEFRQELRGIRDTYSAEVFESFDIKPYGQDELISLLQAQERQSRRIDARLRIRYDVNTPSLIRFQAQDLRDLICSVPAQEIGRLVNADPDGSIFDLNIRRFLGTRGAVNKDIQETCTSPESSYEFWFLNNGITVVCDRFDANTDPDDAHIKLENMQIVNGCQTATTLAVAHREGTLAPDVRVMVRVYETSDTELVDKIVLTTNNQNKISSRDLRANDPVQIDMEDGFRIYGFYYERKTRQFDTGQIPINRIFANELVGQWYLAVVLKNPADARGRKYKVWGEHYNKIFSGQQPIEPYIIASLLGQCVGEWIDKSGLRSDTDDIRRMLAKRGAFHLGRIAAFYWRNSDDWRGSRDDLAQRVQGLESDCEDVKSHIEGAFARLEQIIRENEDFAEDIDRALKSYSLDETISRTVHTS